MQGEANEKEEVQDGSGPDMLKRYLKQRKK